MADVDPDELASVYEPLAEHLHDAVMARRACRPFVIGIAGSVAVGKTTIALVLQGLLRRWPEHALVDVVGTDGFLQPQASLEARGLTLRKGFPESYDGERLHAFLAAVRAGEQAAAPLYSHDLYDVVDGATQLVDRPDILIVEGVYVELLDEFDLTIYVDADEADIVQWYLARKKAPLDTAMWVWQEVNSRNLAEHILPTRDRADVVIRKGADHRVVEVRHR